MEVFLYIIPFITSLVLLTAFRKETVWWEYVLVIVPPIIFTLLLKLIMTSIDATDTEYLGGYALRATHYEDWDETVMVAHTRTISNGKTTTTQTYYVPERKYHPDRYSYISSLDSSEHFVSKEVYMAIKKKLNAPSQFRDMHRKYRTKDGDAHDTYWSGNIKDMYDITVPHLYINKAAASNTYSIFKENPIKRKQAMELGLYDYPQIDRFEIQNPILGDSLDTESVQAIRTINAIYGKPYQFRMYICLFHNEPMEISELQKRYWKGGNKNEFVVCIGMANDSTVAWSNSFSWSDSPKLEVLTRDWFIEHPILNLPEYAQYISEKIPNNWERKSFEDFKYINIELSKAQLIVLFILMIGIEIGITFFVIKNSYRNS